MNPVLLPAIGALLVLAFDLLGRSIPEDERVHRVTALEGIRLGSIAVFTIAAVVLSLRRFRDPLGQGLLAVDGFAATGILLVALSALVVLSLSLTHFGMARSRPAEPIALLLLSWSGSMAAIAAQNLLVLILALELAWLPLIALVAIDPRRLSSSESSLKIFFAHAFASLVFAHGVAFVFGATGGLALSDLASGGAAPSFLFRTGVTLVILGLVARAVVAPFHPWSPDVHEGAPSFVTAHLATVTQATTFFVLLRVLHALPIGGEPVASAFSERLPDLLAWLGVLGLVWGHAMALVQVGLRRLVGWLGVGQAGFFALALVDSQGDGGPALVLALVAAGAATAGVMAVLASLSHHERACEQIGDLGGMLQRSPIRAALLGLFLMSLGGLPGTIGFVARFEILSALERSGHRALLVLGLVGTVLALTAVGRPMLAMVRPEEAGQGQSRALSHEQFVLATCGLVVLYLGVAPLVGDDLLSAELFEWIDRAFAALRR